MASRTSAIAGGRASDVAVNTRLSVVVFVLLFSFLLYRFVPFPPVSSLRSVAPFPLGLLCRIVSLCCVVFLFSAVCYRRRILLVPLYIHVRPVFA